MRTANPSQRPAQKRRLHADETQIGLATYRCNQRRAAAFVRHMQDVGLRQVLEELGRDMQIGANTGR